MQVFVTIRNIIDMILLSIIILSCLILYLIRLYYKYKDNRRIKRYNNYINNKKKKCGICKNYTRCSILNNEITKESSICKHFKGEDYWT